MLDQISKTLLRRILIASTASFRGVEALRFRADHAEHLDLLDTLQAERLIEVRRGRYYVRLSALKHIGEGTHQVESLLYLCQHLFQALQKHYRQHPGEPIDMDALAEQADLPRGQIAKGLAYMTDAAIFKKWATDSDGMYTSITPAEQIVRLPTFNDAIDAQERQITHSRQDAATAASSASSIEHKGVAGGVFVDLSRIDELRYMDSDEFDLTRLVRLCEELNSSLDHGNLIATGLLVRTILDHVPPLFGQRNFTEVANNYAHRAIKKSLQTLDSSVRYVSDSLLHQQIRKSESLPNRVTVDSARDLDVLLAEVARILREKQKQ